MKKIHSYEIKEILGNVTPVQTANSTFIKGVLKTLAKYSEDDPGEEGVDIRYYNHILKIPNGRGIRLTEEEAHAVCDILVQNGYGSTKTLESELERRKSLYLEKGEDNE